jgi:soluble lytic murein transglycosylase-like protein
MVIGGLKGADAVDDVGQALVIEPGTQSAARMTARGPLARVLAWMPLVEEAARRFGVDSALLMAVIDVESGGNPLAVSVKGAKGLMQLMPQTGMQQGADDLFDPHQNILAGARLLDALLAMFGDWPLALAAYNAGEGAVRKYGGAIPPYAETREYVQRVMQRVAYYRRQGRKKSPAEPGFQKSLRPH